MNQKSLLFTIILLISLLSLISCGANPQEKEPLQQNQLPVIQQNVTTEPNTDQTTDTNSNGYPIDVQSSYPVSGQIMPLTDEEQNETLPIPQPSNNAATVSGVILDIMTQQAPAESNLYLGLMQETNKGLPVITLDRDKAPVTTPLKNGQFVFTEVPPGTYGVILFNPDASFLVDDPQNTELSLMLTVEAGQTIDLGTITTTLP